MLDPTLPTYQLQANEVHLSCNGEDKLVYKFDSCAQEAQILEPANLDIVYANAVVLEDQVLVTLLNPTVTVMVRYSSCEWAFSTYGLLLRWTRRGLFHLDDWVCLVKWEGGEVALAYNEDGKIALIDPHIRRLEVDYKGVEILLLMTGLLIPRVASLRRSMKKRQQQVIEDERIAQRVAASQQHKDHLLQKEVGRETRRLKKLEDRNRVTS